MSETTNAVKFPPECATCGKTDYSKDDYTPPKNQTHSRPSGSWVLFRGGDRMWICRDCSRDPAQLLRLEEDPTLRDKIIRRDMLSGELHYSSEKGERT